MDRLIYLLLKFRVGAVISETFKLPLSISNIPMFKENSTLRWMAYLRRHLLWPLASSITQNSLKVNVLGMKHFSFISFELAYSFQLFFKGLSMVSHHWVSEVVLCTLFLSMSFLEVPP